MSEYQLELRGSLIQTAPGVYDLDLFVIDHISQEYLVDGVAGTAELLYMDEQPCASIAFDEYFGNSTGSFKISFVNVPDYPFKGVRITLTNPAEKVMTLPMGETIDAQPVQGRSFISTFAKPLEI